MISQTALDAFQKLTFQAINETLHYEKAVHHWNIIELKKDERIRAREFTLLTMCTYDFRLFTTLHFTYNERTINYVAESLNISRNQIDRQKFYDYLGEYGNNYCGTLKRELGQIFPHLGMSTPDRLDRRVFPHFENLKYEHTLHLKATSEQKVNLYFGLFVCPYGDLDFKISKKIETISTGELELF